MKHISQLIVAFENCMKSLLHFFGETITIVGTSCLTVKIVTLSEAELKPWPPSQRQGPWVSLPSLITTMSFVKLL